MAKYRRKRYARRRKGRGRRRRVKRMRRMRGRRRVHHFKRTFASTLTVTAASIGLGSQTYKLSDVPNSGDFQNLFDLFRINKVAVRFIPKFTGTSASSGNLDALGQFVSVLDFTDADTPVNINQLLEYENVRRSKLSSVHRRVFCPSVSMIGYKGPFTNSYAPRWKQWVNMTDVATLHYGLKFAVDNQGGSAIDYDVYTTLYFSCRQVK